MLTVIIPTTGRDSLKYAVQSVERQTVETKIVVEYDWAYTGTGPTLNRGLTHVETEWVCALGDDDTIAPWFAERLEEYQDADMVIFQLQYPDGQKLPFTTNVDALIFGSVGSSYAIKTELVWKLGGWIDEPCDDTLAEDWTIIEMARDSGATIIVVPEVAYYVRPPRDSKFNTYKFNKDCICDWCSNGGRTTKGYFTESMYGKVYQVSDSYENPHRPPVLE